RYQPTFAERYPVAMLAALADFMLVVVAVYLAHWWRFDNLQLSSRYLFAAMLSAVTVMLSLWASGLYGSWRGKSFASQVWVLAMGWMIAIGVLLTIAFFIKASEGYSRQWFLYFVLIGSGLSALLRLLMFGFLRQLRSSGRN